MLIIILRLKLDRDGFKKINEAIFVVIDKIRDTQDKLVLSFLLYGCILRGQQKRMPAMLIKLIFKYDIRFAFTCACL